MVVQVSKPGYIHESERAEYNTLPLPGSYLAGKGQETAPDRHGRSAPAS